ncbi:MAG TPA: hypothetical protein PLF22_01860 [Pseudomonadales bacterium]|nr:hypothetical protein [Pseudomonadales bacterium]
MQNQTMSALSVKTPPLLLDNERLRQCMRERENWQPADYRPAVIDHLLKPAAAAALAALQPASGDGVWPQQAWPDLLRQLHWELCSSTNLRPLAKIMNKAALLPDPFVACGGMWATDAAMPVSPPQHPVTQLFAVLRMDVVLSGHVVATVAGIPAANLSAGDVILTDADAAIAMTADVPAAILWTAFFYSPDPCCCRQRMENS